jgi:heptosyltransferase II
LPGIKESFKKGIIAAGNLYFHGRHKMPVPENPQKILVFTRKAIGDIIMAIPAFRALRNRYPHAHLALCTLEWNREVVKPLSFFDDIIILENAALLHQSARGLLKFVFRMKKNSYDMAVLLDSFMFPFYCYAAGIPVRVGFEEGSEGFALTHKVKIDESDYRRDNFLKVAALAGADIRERDMTFPSGLDDGDQEIVQRLLPRQLIDRFPVIVGVAVGGGRNPGQKMPSRNWTKKGFAEVISRLIDNRKALIVLFGKGDDADVAEDILELIDPAKRQSAGDSILNLINKTSIVQSAALLRKCDLLLANDTALMHLAIAVNTPTVSVFGPTSPKARVPAGSRHIAITSLLPCTPCYERKGFLYCQGECMQDISGQNVYEAIVSLVDENKGNP